MPNRKARNLEQEGASGDGGIGKATSNTLKAGRRVQRFDLARERSGDLGGNVTSGCSGQPGHGGGAGPCRRREAEEGSERREG